MFFKRLFSVILTVQMLFVVLPSKAYATKSVEEYNFTNLIVFAKFSDESEFINDNYGETVRKITDNTYNTAEYNMSDYFNSVSGGKIKMKSLYLFDNGGSVTLGKTRAYYASQSDENPEGYADSGERAQRMYQLKEDWANAVNKAISNGITDYSGKEKYDFSELDKNNDGYIDLITVIYKPTLQTNISVEWASPLWNYQDSSRLVEIQLSGTTLHSNSYVQMTKDYKYLYADSSGSKITAFGVNAHETAHGFGLYDLYQSAYQPVGYMSAMGKHTTETPQFISVKEREALGWLTDKNIRNVLKEGNYSLDVVRDEVADGVVGYKMDIPEINKTLYMEYRRFDGKGSKYDSQKKNLFGSNGSQIKGLSFKSGLVCYLLTTGIKFPNNLYSSVNNWNYSVIGGQYNNKPDAALSLGDGMEITDDIYIEVTEMTDDKLTFRIEGSFFDSSERPTVNGIKITDFPEEVSAGNRYNLKAEIIGTNNPPQSVIWSVENNSDVNTEISDNGVLTVGENETSASIKITASYENIYFDSKNIILKSNSHNFEYHAAIKASCDHAGNFEYYLCLDCGKYFVDTGEGYEETMLENMTINRLNHTPSKWIITKNPTPEEKGEMHRECTGCHKILETAEIDYYPSPSDKPSSLEMKIHRFLKNFWELILKILRG